MKKQVMLDPGYPPNIIESNRPVFSIDSMCDVRYNDEEVGSMDGVMEHITKVDNLGWINGAIVRWRESNNT